MARQEEIQEASKEYQKRNFGYYQVDKHQDIDYSSRMNIVDINKTFIDAAEWADKTMIGKACEWLKENVDDYIFNDGKEWMSDWKVNVEEMLEDFKKAMEE